MKGLSTLFFINLLFAAAFSAENGKNEAQTPPATTPPKEVPAAPAAPATSAIPASNDKIALSSGDQVRKYEEMIKAKTPAFICTVYAKIGNSETKEMAKELSSKYAEALQVQKTEKVVSNSTGVGQNEAKTIDNGTEGSKGSASNPQEVQKPLRLLEGNAPTTETKASETNPTTAPKTEDNKQAAQTDIPKAAKVEKAPIIRTVVIECKSPKESGDANKHIIEGKCGEDKISFWYKPADKTDWNKTTTPFTDKDDLFFATDVMPFKATNAFKFDDKTCNLQVSATEILKIAIGLFFVFSNLL